MSYISNDIFYYCIFKKLFWQPCHVSLTITYNINILDETFVPSSEIFAANTPVAAIQNDEQVTEATNSKCYRPDFDIGAKKLPVLYPEFHDIGKRDLVDDSLKKDIAWSLAEGIDEYTESQSETFLGSWTWFKKDTSNLMFDRCIAEYLPMVPEPPE